MFYQLPDLNQQSLIFDWFLKSMSLKYDEIIFLTSENWWGKGGHDPIKTSIFGNFYSLNFKHFGRKQLQAELVRSIKIQN